MRISLVSAKIPFVTGGAEQQAQDLMAELKKRGHKVELILIPFLSSTPNSLLRSIVAARAMPVNSGDPDLVIAMRFPAYLAPYPNKKLWIMHQHRQVYDLWGTEYQDMPNTVESRHIRDRIIRADNVCFRQAKSIYTTTHNVARRLKNYNGIDAAAVLYPPLPSPELYTCERSDNYFVYVSRISSLKRQLLAINAMRYVKSSVKLVIAGFASQARYQAYLDLTVSAYHLEDRVKFLGPVSSQEKAELLAHATGVIFTPYDEDYGYVTLEAMQACKPIVTCRDSGTVTEFVEDGVNGFVVAPDAQEIAAAMEHLIADKPKAKEMGRNGRAALDARDLSWDTVLAHLLA